MLGTRDRKPHVAIVDDDPMVRSSMASWLQTAGYAVSVYADGEAFLASMPSDFSTVCLDLGLSGMSGFEVLRALGAVANELPAVVLASAGDVELAVAAMREGAYDFVEKPLDRERLTLAVHRAVERWKLSQSLETLRSELSKRGNLEELVGRSAAIQELSRQIRQVLEGNFPVLLLGEPGTGKDVVARAIHRSRGLETGRLVTINLSAVPEALHEQELFGQVNGSCTLGRFLQAEGGTLFLDQIGDLSALSQASLLRTLQTNKVRPVGADSEFDMKARLVCATSRDLLSEVRAGRFREDLYFALAFHPVHLPPLRERREDIPALVTHFLRKYQGETGRTVGTVQPEAMEALTVYDWPGNVRELEDVVHRALLAANSHEMRIDHLPSRLRSTGAGPAETEDLIGVGSDIVLPLREIERRAIKRALRATNGSVEKAAKLLGMGRATLYRRLAHYDSTNQSVV
ncbi:MAG: sigma-54-dependent transcriptional regulator [Myxococcota bacterium]